MRFLSRFALAVLAAFAIAFGLTGVASASGQYQATAPTSGQYCGAGQHGIVVQAANGQRLKCEHDASGNTWRWRPTAEPITTETATPTLSDSASPSPSSSSGSPAPDSLPVTGGPVIALGVFGATLFMVGIVAIAMSRRRRVRFTVPSRD